MKNFKQNNSSKLIVIVFLLMVNCFLPIIIKAQRPDVQWMQGGTRFSGALSMDYSPDGQFLATIESSFPVVKFWRTSDGMLIRTLKVPTLRAASDAKIKYLSDGQSILVKCIENNLFNVKQIRISDGAVIQTFGNEINISTFGKLSDGTLVMGTGVNPPGSINAVKFFNFTTGAFIRAVSSITYVNSSGMTVVWGNIASFTSFTENGRLVVGNLSNISDVIDTDGRLIGYLGPGAGFGSISADGSLLAGRSVYRFNQLCNPTQTNCNTNPSSTLSEIRTVAFSPDGLKIAAANFANNALNFYQTSNLSLIRSLPINNPQEPIFSPDSQRVALSSNLDAPTQFYTTRIFNFSDGTLVRRLESHYFNVQNVLFSPDGLTALSLSTGFPESVLANNNENIIRVWNAADGTLIRSIPTGETGSWQSNRNLAFSPDGQLVFYKTDAKNIQVRNLSDGALVRTITVLEFNSIGFVLSPNGQFIAAFGISPSTIALYRVSDGVRMWNKPGSGLALAFTQDSLGVFNGSGLLNTANGNLIRNFTLSTPFTIYSVSTSPDGQSVAFTGYSGSGNSNGNTEIRRISDASLIRTFTRTGGGWNKVAKFSPNNQQIAIAGDEAAIRLYNLNDGTLARFYDEEVPSRSNSDFANVQSLEFSPDGSRFAYGRDDATMVVAANPCLYSLSQPSISIGAAGGSNSFNISTASGCAWQAASNAPWLTVSNSGNGNGTINFTFSANTGTPRTGQISVGGETFTVNQNGVLTATIQTNPVGRSFTVDGTNYNSTQTFTWDIGSAHTVNTTSPQNGTAGTQYVWANWSDGGAISHTASPTANTTYTANFTTQYQLTMNAGSGGTVSPANGFYNAGQSVQIAATPNSGFTFASWAGTGSGSYSGTNNPATITMNAPVSQTASFNVQCSYSLNPISANIAATGGSGNFAVIAPNGCAWTASSNTVWLTTSSAGSGNGIVNYTVTTNIGATRSTTINVGGQIFTVNQSANVSTAQRRYDFDGDGKDDISVFRPSNGIWYLLNSQSGFGGLQFGAAGDKIVPADYDGDGKTDVAVYRDGNWYLQRSNLGFTNIQFGVASDIPVPADFDGDGKADVAVYRPSIGTWFIQQSTLGFIGIQFGQTEDKPIAADFDGDGKADLAVFRPSTGIWYIQQSTAGFTGVQFGSSEDKPVVADYDGDGKADIAVYRPANGFWYLLRSQSGFTGVQFGQSTDLPVPADYDGDGRADVAVFRSDTWFLNRSTQGFTAVQFGAAGDKPTPNAFVP